MSLVVARLFSVFAIDGNEVLSSAAGSLLQQGLCIGLVPTGLLLGPVQKKRNMER